MSQGSVVGIANRLWAEWSGVRIPIVARDFSLLQTVQTISWAHPASHSMGTGVLSRGKEAGRGADTPSSAEVQNEWARKLQLLLNYWDKNRKIIKVKAKVKVHTRKGHEGPERE